jgi:hypothetical protein
MRMTARFSAIGFFLAASYCLAQENPHKVLKLDCQTCHNSNSWHEISYDHAKTGFSLDGQHANLTCTDCHSIEDFSAIDSQCISCHIDIHQGKLAHSCDNCHITQAWTVMNVTTAHANTTFPLVGKHASLDCRACHISDILGEFSFLRSDCISCHQADFNAAQNPSHSNLGFGTRCEDCHTLVSWQPADYSKHESFFPIYSGAHQGRWGGCLDCHTSEGNYSVFSCFECHEHNQELMDSRHKDVRGYVYDSNACYHCHPSGSRGN